MKEYRHTMANPCHISVGGVAYQNENDELKVVILGRNEADGAHYHLPKGTLHHNETLENCARREVLEESGCRCSVGKLISTDTQSYTARDGVAVIKTLIYFEMPIIENVEQHDDEHDWVECVGIEEAIEKLRNTEPKKKEFLVVERFLKSYNSCG